MAWFLESSSSYYPSEVPVFKKKLIVIQLSSLLYQCPSATFVSVYIPYNKTLSTDASKKMCNLMFSFHQGVWSFFDIVISKKMFSLSRVFRKYKQWFKKACYATVSLNNSNPNLACFVILVVQHPYLWVVAGWSACIHRFWRFVFPSYFTLDLRPPDIS